MENENNKLKDEITNLKFQNSELNGKNMNLIEIEKKN